MKSTFIYCCLSDINKQIKLKIPKKKILRYFLLTTINKPGGDVNKHQPAGAFHAPEWVGYPFFSRNDYPYPLCVHGKQIYKRGSYCKAVKTAWSPRHPFRPCGKIRTADFIGYAWQKRGFAALYP